MRLAALKIVIMLGFVSGLLGCESIGLMTKEELIEHPIGLPPKNHEALIKRFFDGRLKDPYSAHYEFTVPVPGKLWKGLVNGGWDYGWLCMVSVNAKNSFGGYTGNQPWGILIRKDEIVNWITPRR